MKFMQKYDFKKGLYFLTEIVVKWMIKLFEFQSTNWRYKPSFICFDLTSLIAGSLEITQKNLVPSWVYTNSYLINDLN